VAPPPPKVRRRLLVILFAGSGLARIGFIATVTVAPLVGEDLLGSASLAGLPNAAGTVGLALGTAPIAAIMARRGRRIGIVGGLGTALLGALIAAVAIGLESFPLFVVGLLLFGFGAAGDRLSRYAAADISAPERRSFSISIVVWAGTVGAIVGPTILRSTERAAEALGLNGLAGAPLMAAVAIAAAATLLQIGLRPDPLSFVDVPLRPKGSHRQSIRPLLATRNVRYAITALAIGQVVMVMIMTMTPIHIRRAGEGLGIVGLVIGAHTFGMFAVSPLTGFLADRIGRLPVMISGQVVLVTAAVLAATAAGDERWMLLLSLFLLGLGWNMGYVAGSAYLTEHAPDHARVALEGLADTVVWSSAAAASLSSGFLLEAAGYPALSLLAAAMVIAPVVLLVRYGRSLSPPQVAVG
jgi:MFS family permease